jgi:hypothetical protein
MSNPPQEVVEFEHYTPDDPLGREVARLMKLLEQKREQSQVPIFCRRQAE